MSKAKSAAKDLRVISPSAAKRANAARDKAKAKVSSGGFDESKHPRVPPGSANAGEWTSGGYTSLGTGAAQAADWKEMAAHKRAIQQHTPKPKAGTGGTGTIGKGSGTGGRPGLAASIAPKGGYSTDPAHVKEWNRISSKWEKVHGSPPRGEQQQMLARDRYGPKKGRVDGFSGKPMLSFKTAAALEKKWIGSIGRSTKK